MLRVPKFFDSGIDSSKFFLPHHLICEMVYFEKAIFIFEVMRSFDQS